MNSILNSKLKICDRCGRSHFETDEERHIVTIDGVSYHLCKTCVATVKESTRRWKLHNLI
jgi:hypothetical protein